MEINWSKIYNTRRKITHEQRFNTQKLINCQETTKKYQENLNTNIIRMRIEGKKGNNELKRIIRETAEKNLGYVEKVQNKQVEDEVVLKMSKAQKKIRLEIESQDDAEKIQKLKKDRKQILKNMEKRIKKVKGKEIDKLVREIENAKDDTSMFKAVRNTSRKTFQNNYIHDKEGKSITKPEEIHKITEEHFKQQFYKEGEEKVEMFVGEGRKLRNEITAEEVKKAVNRMTNNRAPGKDNINIELIKYAPQIVHDEIKNILNDAFENNTNINIGDGILLPIPKPKKTKGPVTNLRPITLLESIRKILSKILINRSDDQVDQYISLSQSAYRKHRSTSDIIWSYRWIIAKVQEYKELQIFITGIDMTSAFDTIQRQKLIDIAKSFMNEDEVRILRLLLSNTTLEVKTVGVQSNCFNSNIGSPQGDSASGRFFTVYFENALREVRNTIYNVRADEITFRLVEQNRSSLPKEMIYADDCDFLTLNETIKEKTVEKVSEVLGRHNLLVNDEKTEHVVLKRGDRNTELWRNVKKLGSLLGDKEDICRRKQLASIAMNKSKKIWKRKNLVSQERRIKLYNSIVKSILLYNSGTWGLTKNDEKKLNTFHRKQLKQVLGIKWPHRIRSITLYETTKTVPI